MAVISLRDILNDLDGVADGIVMAKEGCGKVESMVSFLVCDTTIAYSDGR